jgi:putative transposase
LDLSTKKSLVSPDSKLTIKRQSELLGINRTGFYYKTRELTEEEVKYEECVMSRIDFWHTKYCVFGSRKIAKKLIKEDKIIIGRKRVRKYMREMGICAVYAKPNLSKSKKQDYKFPYLLKNINIFIPNQVWAIDITYIKMGKTHMYLTAIIDWYSRFIVGWELSDTLETAPVLDAVKSAIDKHGIPGIINSDQGSQFTSTEYINLLKKGNIRQSMDGKARWIDNVIIERWFRNLKCEDIYITEYSTPADLRRGIKNYIQQYNNSRPHQSLGYQYPCEVYYSAFVA